MEQTIFIKQKELTFAFLLYTPKTPSNIMAIFIACCTKVAATFRNFRRSTSALAEKTFLAEHAVKATSVSRQY